MVDSLVPQTRGRMLQLNCTTSGQVPAYRSLLVHRYLTVHFSSISESLLYLLAFSEAAISSMWPAKLLSNSDLHALTPQLEASTQCRSFGSGSDSH